MIIVWLLTFVFKSMYGIHCSYWFAYVEPSLYLSGKASLAIVNIIFDASLYSICMHFIENIYTYIHQEYWPIVFIFVVFWFWYEYYWLYGSMKVFLQFLYLIVLCVCVLFLHVCKCLWSKISEENIRSPQTRITEGCDPPCVCWGLNLGPL